MASPQKERGYSPIANELLDAIIQHPFTGTELKIVMAVVRHTYGWSRAKAQIKYYTIAKMTNTDRANVRKLTLALAEKKVIFMQECKDGSFIIGMNKNYEEWQL